MPSFQMHPKLREIIDTTACCRQTIRDASQFLPDGEDELDTLIAEAIESNDSISFAYLAVGAMHRGLPIRSRHLEKGLKFSPSYITACHMVLHVTGDDVPERVARALQLGAIVPLQHAAILVGTWHWCANRGMPLPKEMLSDARGAAYRWRKNKDARAMFIHLAHLADDPRMRDMLIEVDGSGGTLEKLKEANEEMDVTLRKLFRDDVLDMISDKPAPPKRPKTLRRAVAHIGRNDPCPCGSGKKHKKCCFDKTRERLLHSSDVAGMTMKELSADLEPHMTLGRLNSLNASDLVVLDPLRLDPSLISPLVERLSGWRLFEDATAVLEKVGMSDELEDTWYTVMMCAAEMRRRNVVARLVALHPCPDGVEEKDHVHVAARLLLAEGDAEKTLALLEETADLILDQTSNYGLALNATGFVTSPLGVLGIMLAQAVIPRIEIKEAIYVLEHIEKRRAELDLPIEDPFSAIIDKRIAAEARKEENKDSAKLAAAMRKMDALAEKERKSSLAARQMEKELAKLSKKAAERKDAPGAPPHDDSEMKALREKLRIHEANEKINAEERAAHRRATSELLLLEESLREKERNLKKAAPPREDDNEETLLIQGELEGTQPLRLITWPGKFLASLRPFPRHVGRQAIALLGRIASGEPAAFHDVLRLKACNDIFRARVGIDHRLLFRLHPEDLEVIALIDRRDLDSRIKTLRKHD